MSREGWLKRCGVIDDVDGLNKYIDMPTQFIKIINMLLFIKPSKTNTLVMMLLSQQ